MGGSPSYAMLFHGFYPLFSLWQKAQRKKLGKKEHAEGRDFASAEATADRGGSDKPLKRLDLNLLTLRAEECDKSQFADQKTAKSHRGFPRQLFT